MNFMFQNIKQPKVSELWEKEKQNYRPWIIAFAVSIVTILILFIASTIVSYVQKQDFIDLIVKNGQELKVAENYFWSYFTSDVLISLIFVAAGITYGLSIKKSYKEKNFARLSTFATNLFFVLFLINTLRLSSILFNLRNFQNTWHLAFIPMSIFIAVSIIFIYFFVSRKISLIRKTFIGAERMEMIQKQVEEMKKNGGMNDFPFGPFGFPMQNQNAQAEMNNEQMANNTPESELNPETEEEKENRIKLEQLEIQDLQKIAKSLEISGYESMSREELIKIILKLTSNNN